MFSHKQQLQKFFTNTTGFTPVFREPRFQLPEHKFVSRWCHYLFMNKQPPFLFCVHHKFIWSILHNIWYNVAVSALSHPTCLLACTHCVSSQSETVHHKIWFIAVCFDSICCCYGRICTFRTFGLKSNQQVYFRWAPNALMCKKDPNDNMDRGSDKNPP